MQSTHDEKISLYSAGTVLPLTVRFDMPISDRRIGLSHPSMRSAHLSFRYNPEFLNRYDWPLCPMRMNRRFSGCRRRDQHSWKEGPHNCCKRKVVVDTRRMGRRVIIGIGCIPEESRHCDTHSHLVRNSASSSS